MLSRKCIWLIISSVIAMLIGGVNGSKLVSALIDYERNLYKLKKNILAYHKDCTYTCQSTAASTTPHNSCSIDACVSSLQKHPASGVVKSTKFGPCGPKCLNTSRYLDFKHSSVTNADRSYKTTSLKERGELACWTTRLDPEWKSNLFTVDHMSWQYFGTPLGLYRIYPGHPQERCSSYDPRIRSWYVAATTGPKDVVIVLDTSGSMSVSNRIKLAKEAAISVVSALTILDRFNVVEYNSGASSLVHSKELVRGTTKNKKKAIDEIEKLDASGSTNMQSGFTTAFQLMENSITSEASTGCHKIILFLTDGKPTLGKKGAELEKHVKDSNSKFKAAIFTYSLGSGAATDLPKNIACQNNGIWTLIKDGTVSLRTQMSYYYDYISSFRNSSTSVVWVEPYIDAFGAGKLTTAAMAVYDNSNSPASLLGVIAMDITVTDMEKLEPSSSKLLDVFIRRSTPTCPKIISKSKCSMEALRKKNYAKLDPEYVNIPGYTDQTHDATCFKNLNCTEQKSAEVCPNTIRSSKWCTQERTDFASENCANLCKRPVTSHGIADATPVATLYFWLCSILMQLISGIMIK